MCSYTTLAARSSGGPSGFKPSTYELDVVNVLSKGHQNSFLLNKICQTCGLFFRDLQIFVVTLHPSHLKNVLTAMEYLEGYWGSIPQWTRTQQLWSTSAEVGGVTPNKRDPVKENWNTLRRENTLGKRIKFHVMILHIVILMILQNIFINQKSSIKNHQKSNHNYIDPGAKLWTQTSTFNCSVVSAIWTIYSTFTYIGSKRAIYRLYIL